ncbi:MULTISPECIES: sensor histidine kinase [unclassified Mycobacterium]|uniref:sensor histidine kinase n=1 Tax=unclassified Mycobacterium TaxID=2642494 RepID=UPI0029C75C3F|nr:MULTISPECIES: ATP-binding protein [unclassified Mycobacterium]
MKVDTTEDQAPQHRSSRRPGIGLRLLLAQALVLTAGAATTWIVAAIVGPPLFREHLHRAGVSANSMEEVHAEEAYRYATVLSIGVALAVSALTALAVSWYVSRRLQRSVAEVAGAARAVADGRYDIRVSPLRLGDDFDALAEAFNQMASRLQTVEATRRRLFGDLAHEIRTPVSVLDAYMEAFDDGVRSPTPETTAMLRDQTRRLVRFSEDVAALAQAEESSSTLAVTSIDVGELVDNALTAARERFAAAAVELDAEVPTELPRICGDPQRLAQVLGNLLDNSLRHTPRGGRVTVGVQVHRDRLTMHVADSGEGIAAEHLPHLFERFYRVDAARNRRDGGAGIGLAITKALVEAHGGHVAATSAGVGAGAQFTIVLPLAGPPGANLIASRASPSSW